MADAARINVNLVVISALKTLVSKEMYFVELAFDEFKAEALVPSYWEHVK